MPVMCRDGDSIYFFMDNSFIIRNIYCDNRFYLYNID